MKKIVFIMSAFLSVAAVTAQVRIVSTGSAPIEQSVVSVGSTPVPKRSPVKKVAATDTIREFDRKTKQFMAEPQFECIYNYVINNSSKGDTISELTSCVLQIGEGVSRFSDYTTYSTDSAANILGADDYIKYETSKREWTNIYAFDEIVYQNYPAGKMTVYGAIAPYHYVYEEDANPIEWEITEQTDTVCGYECVMAEGSYGGRIWRAWFTAEIPAPLGPWKIGGLPGLVMKAADADNIHVFEAISFRRADVPVYRPGWPDAVKIDRKKFIEKKTDFENADDPFSKITPESIRELTVMKGSNSEGHTLVVNSVPIRKKDNGYIPRELK